MIASHRGAVPAQVGFPAWMGLVGTTTAPGTSRLSSSNPRLAAESTEETSGPLILS